MTTSYPGGLDAFTNPTSGDNLDSPSHSQQHADANDAIEAVQAELGTDPAGAYSTVKARLAALDQLVFDAVAYGAVVDGTTDDTVAWQAAIDACAAAGGGIVTSSKPGVSVVAGALQDTSGANAQLLLPSIDVTTGEQISVTICGPTPPPAGVSVIGSIPTPDNHLILKSTLTTGSGGALLGGYGPAGSYQNFTCLDLTIRDVAFRMPSNPTHTALNLSNVTQATLDRVVVDCGSYNVTGLTQPTTATSYGIKLPKRLNGAHTRLTQVDVIGFYTGILAPEHTFGKYVAAWGCVRGVEVPAGDHASTFVRLGVYHCTTGIVFTGGASALDVWQYDAEHAATSEATWLQTVSDVSDPSNYGSGFIRWWAVLAGTGAHNSFTKSGGSGITTSRMGASFGTSGTTTYVYRDRLTAATGDIKVTLGATPVANSPLVWVNGAIKWPGTDYTISGNLITFGSALTAGDVVAVQYQSTASSAAASALSSFAVNIADTFDRTNSTSSLGTTTTGAKTWVQNVGTWGIQTNLAYLSAGTAATVDLATVASGTADFTMSATLTSATAATGGFGFRLTDSSNFYLAEVTVGGSGTPKIWKCVGGTYTTIATGASTTVATGSVLTLEVSGSSITLKDDGVTIVSVTDSTFTTPTSHGLYVSAGSGVSSPLRFNDFSITA